MKRLRIINHRLDGTLSTDPPTARSGPVAIPRGKHIIATIVDDDGTETPLPAFRSLKLIVSGRTDPIIARVEFVDVELALDDVCLCEAMQAGPGGHSGRSYGCGVHGT